VDISVTVCLFVCLFFVRVCVRLWISPPRIKLAESNFARRFIGVQGRESHILGNFAPPGPRSPKSDESRGASALSESSDRDAIFVEYRAARGRRIGMCGYTAFPKTDVPVLVLSIWSFIITVLKYYWPTRMTAD